MERINVIRDRAYSTALHQEEWKRHYRDDVQYLLSEVERLSGVLQGIAEDEYEVNSNDSAVLMGKAAIYINKMRAKARRNKTRIERMD